MAPCTECSYRGDDLICPACGAAMDRPCIHCGEPVEADLWEFWPEEEAFLLQTCCAGLYEGIAQDLAYANEIQDPLQRYRWLKPIAALLNRYGADIRQLYYDQGELRYRFDPGLRLAVISFQEAMAFVATHHRHNEELPGWKWGHAAYSGALLVGVAIVGKPRARKLNRNRDQPHYPLILEVNRLCLRTDVDPAITWNASSLLYGAAVQRVKQENHRLRRTGRAERDLYQRLITYTLRSESGRSLKAAGWEIDRMSDGGSWNSASRAREDKASTEGKIRWTRWVLPRVQQELFDLGRLQPAA